MKKKYIAVLFVALAACLTYQDYNKAVAPKRPASVSNKPVSSVQDLHVCERARVDYKNSCAAYRNLLAPLASQALEQNVSCSANWLETVEDDPFATKGEVSAARDVVKMKDLPKEQILSLLALEQAKVESPSYISLYYPAQPVIGFSRGLTFVELLAAQQSFVSGVASKEQQQHLRKAARDVVVARHNLMDLIMDKRYVDTLREMPSQIKGYAPIRKTY